jgi:colanic acid/amylovoran biosynthesis protein
MTVEILLLNIHSSRNSGDAALTHTAIEQLERGFPQSHITLAMDDPGSHSGDQLAVDSIFSWVRRAGDRWRLESLAWLIPGSIIPILTYRLVGRPVMALTPKHWRSLLRSYIQSHVAISKPGGFLYSSGRGVTFGISVYTLALAVLAGKPVYMFPQSIGPILRRREHALLSWVMRRVRVVMVREEISLDQLQDLGVPSLRRRLVPDLAFGFRGAPPRAAEEWLRGLGMGADHSSPLMGMTTINWGAQDSQFVHQTNYEVGCAEVARHFIEQYGGRVLLFPQVLGPSPTQDDRVPARRIVRRLADMAPHVFLVEHPPSPGLLKAVYGQMDVFIGTRMHSNIFALSQGVPVIAIGYQPKTEGIMRMAGLGRWTISIQQTTGQALTRMLTTLWNERDGVRAHLQQRIPYLVQQAEQAGSMIVADYAALIQVPKDAQAAPDS